MYHTLFGYFSGILLILSEIPYLYSIVVTKETRPSRSSWVIWAGIGLINLTAYFYSGERETIWFVLIATLNPIVVFVLSLKYGEKQWYPSDTYCLLLAIFAIFIWKWTHIPVLALGAGLLADLIGLIPTLLKVKRNPYSENLLSWSMCFCASVCNVIAVKQWTWANGLYTGYMAIGCGLFVLYLVKGQFHSMQKT